MNAFFDDYINFMTMLQQFVQQYNNALQHKLEKEKEAGFASLNTVIHCGSQSLMERKFQKEYTHAKFSEVQTEFRSKMNCLIHHCHSDRENFTYTLKEESIHNERCHERLFTVFYDRKTKDVQCKCFLFEFRRIICRHACVVIAQERPKSIPTKYILQRWSKNVRRKHNYIVTSFNSKDKPPHIQRYDALCERFGE